MWFMEPESNYCPECGKFVEPRGPAYIVWNWEKGLYNRMCTSCYNNPPVSKVRLAPYGTIRHLTLVLPPLHQMAA